MTKDVINLPKASGDSASSSLSKDGHLSEQRLLRQKQSKTSRQWKALILVWLYTH